MKIAYYLPSLYAPGGLERIVTFKANYLAEHCEGYEVYIITSEQRDRQIHFALSPKVKHIDLGISFDWPFNQSPLVTCQGFFIFLLWITHGFYFRNFAGDIGRFS